MSRILSFHLTNDQDQSTPCGARWTTEMLIVRWNGSNVDYSWHKTHFWCGDLTKQIIYLFIYFYLINTHAPTYTITHAPTHTITQALNNSTAATVDLKKITCSKQIEI